MSKKKKVDRKREAEADELLLRALRQLADEALEEEIPERLLRPLREAQGGQGGDGGAPQPPNARRRAGSG
jgi:hypothetical protein